MVLNNQFFRKIPEWPIEVDNRSSKINLFITRNKLLEDKYKNDFDNVQGENYRNRHSLN